MSTLRISNIEAKSVPASATIDEKIKITNSSGDPLVFIDGKTSGITTVGINTTDSNITFDANSNVVVAGIITASKFVGIFEPTNLTLSGDLLIPDKIVHTGDTNTAIRFPDADTITAETGGDERFRIDASGDIGLGESNPNRSGYASPVVSVGYDTTNGYSVFELLGNKTSDATIANIVAYNVGGSSRLAAMAFERSGANNSGAIRFETYSSGSAAERLRIDSTGALGLGITPKNNSGNYRQLQIGLGAHFYGRTDDTPIYLVSNGYREGSNWKYTANTTASEIAMGTNIQFFTAAAGNATQNITFNERLRIDNSGRVGINTNTFNDAREALRVQAPAGQTETFLTIKSPSTTGKSNLFFGDNDFNEGRIQYNHSDNSMQFFTNDAEKMRILESGGITFNGDTAAANSLDDYEEGTFTPSFVQGYNSVTYNTQAGFYTKIGRFVSYSIYLYVLSAGGQNAEIRISLPFTTTSTQYLEEGAYIVYDVNTLSTSNDEKSNCYIMSGRNYSYLRLFKNTNGAAIYGNDTTLGTGGNNTYLLIKGFLTTAS